MFRTIIFRPGVDNRGGFLLTSLITHVIIILSYLSEVTAVYVKDSDAKVRLMEAGKAEFLEYGFQRASLRRISARAGLTTGAVYSCFENKEDLFCAIVGNTVEELKRRMQESCETECADASLTVDNDVQIMEYLWHNRDVVMLLLECSEGTRYAGTLPALEALMVELFSEFFRQYAGQDIDRDLVTIIVRMRLKSYVEILKGGYALEQSMELAQMLSVYSNTGYQKLIKDARREAN